DRENPLLTHTIQLQPGKFLSMELGGTRVTLVALPLKDCLTFPGIKDGTLFQKNVRQSLGLNNAVNKGIKHTIYNLSRDFFFSHKKLYDQKYPKGYLITKRGETAPADKDKSLVVDLADLGKYLISWHSQRPNIAYSETRLFDKYFEQLFKRDYKPENVHALSL